MKVLVVSDTHGDDLPAVLLKDMAAADVVIHVGDICDMDHLKMLRSQKEFRGVFGNMDGADIRKELPRQASFRCGELRIGLVHGDGAAGNVLEHVRKVFKGSPVDVVIFGHTHQPVNEVIDGVLYFNPGSATDIVRAPYCSYGILNIDGKKVAGKIVKVS